jgi:hypothetical protein
MHQRPRARQPVAGGAALGRYGVGAVGFAVEHAADHLDPGCPPAVACGGRPEGGVAGGQTRWKTVVAGAGRMGTRGR